MQSIWSILVQIYVVETEYCNDLPIHSTIVKYIWAETPPTYSSNNALLWRPSNDIPRHFLSPASRVIVRLSGSQPSCPFFGRHPKSCRVIVPVSKISVCTPFPRPASQNRHHERLLQWTVILANSRENHSRNEFFFMDWQLRNIMSMSCGSLNSETKKYQTPSPPFCPRLWILSPLSTPHHPCMPSFPPRPECCAWSFAVVFQCNTTSSNRLTVSFRFVTFCAVQPGLSSTLEASTRRPHVLDHEIAAMGLSLLQLIHLPKLIALPPPP